MKPIYNIICMAALLFPVGCKIYDDSSLWQQIDNAQKELASLNEALEALAPQIDLLKTLTSGGVISSVEANAEGGYTISYKDSEGQSATVVVAARNDVVEADMIGIAEEDGIQYWTLTSGGKTSFLKDADGSKLPVSGRAPSIAVSKEGYWTVNGQTVLDNSGNPVKAGGKTASLISAVTPNDDGSVSFTLGDGKIITVDSEESFCIKAYIAGEEVIGEQIMEDGQTSLIINFEVTGKLAEGAIVDLQKAEGLAATLDNASKSIAVSIPSTEDFVGGSIILTATASNGKMVMRSINFCGSTDVEMENNLWKVDKKMMLAPGCTYYAMTFKKITRQMRVLELTLGAPVDIVPCYADDCVPNPNGNNNINNGFCIRETLSMLCKRKTDAGENVLAGINSGFYDANDGISRGAQIRNGQFDYMPNPKIADNLVNHSWAFTIFKDKTASCGSKKFTGKVKIGDEELRFWSVNDTLLRGSGDEAALKSYPVNLYTAMYRQTPHPEHPTLVNKLSQNALYIIAKFNGGGLYVNEGWTEATVTKVVAGNDETPYLSSEDEIAIQIHNSIADRFAGVKAGDSIKLNAEMTIDGQTKPILTQVSTMWQFITNGENTVGTIPVDHDFRKKSDPMTFVTVNKSAKRICLIEIDGRQTGYSTGVTADECAEIAAHLGAWNATRFDGGGSSAMWATLAGTGALVSSPCDGKGERSNLNYIYIIKK